MKSDKGFTITELLVVAAIFFLMVAILTPFVNITKWRSRRIACANNLRELSLGLHKYAAQHNDSFPEKLGDLYPDYVAGEKAFDCPAIKNVGRKEAPDYQYSAGMTEASAPREVLVRDNEGNHGKSGGNIMRVNGSVEWSGSGR